MEKREKLASSLRARHGKAPPITDAEAANTHGWDKAEQALT